MIVAAGFITLDTRECKSLKEKRSIIKSIMGKAKTKFQNAAFAEVDHQNLSSKATIGISVVSNETSFAQTILLKILDFIEDIAFRTTLEHKVEFFML